MQIETLEIPQNWLVPNYSEEVLKQLDDCRDMLNDTGWSLRLKYIESWIHCCRRLESLGTRTGVEITKDFADYSFGWSACGMVGGFIFHPGQGWSLHS